MVNLCIPVLSNYDGLINCLQSASEGHLKPDKMIVLDNGGQFEELFGKVTSVGDVPLEVIKPKANVGVTKSWNFFLENYEDYVVISNDDVVFNKDTIKLLIEAANNNPNEIFFCPTCYWEHEFSLYLLKKTGFESIGKFDETWFVYFSDQDYKYRMKLKGYKPFWVPSCTYEHEDGGSKTSRNNVTGHQFSQDFEYYLQKWGGLPRNETFLTPFNK